MGRLIHKSIKWLGLFILFIAVSAFIYSRQNNPIVGSWIGIHSNNKQGKWVFTSNKFKEYYEGNLDEEYTYKLSQTPNHCGVDMSERLKHFPNNRILILTNTKTGKKTCGLVFKLTDKRLILAAVGNAHTDSLKKVQQ